MSSGFPLFPKEGQGEICLVCPCVGMTPFGELSPDQSFQFFIYLEEKKDLLAFRFPQGSQLIRVSSGCDFVADIVDAEHVSHQKPAT